MIPLIFAAPGQDLPKFAMLMAGPGKMWYAEPWRGFLRRASGLGHRTGLYQKRGKYFK